MQTLRPIIAALALAASLAACGGTPDEFLSVSGQRTSGDLTRPAIVGVLPAPNAVDVSTRTLVEVTFSEPIDTAAVSGANVTVSSGTPGTVRVTGAGLTFVPAARFPAGTTITVTVSGIRDRAGNAMAGSYSWSFTTAAVSP